MNVRPGPGTLTKAYKFVKKKLSFVLLAVIVLCTVAVLWAGYAKILRNLSLVMVELASVKAELASVRLDIGARKDFIPPMFGARHVALRKQFILNQISQADSDFILVVGDSIIEGMHLPNLSGVPVVIAGMGGGGVFDAMELVSQIPSDAKIKGIVVAIGVNDTVRGQLTPGYFEQWGVTLNAVIQKAEQLGHIPVVLSTIIPVENGKPLGDQYFDPQKIEGINRLIREIARDTQAVLVDNDTSFTNLAMASVAYTTDGVHLNAEGYKLMKENIRKATSGSFSAGAPAFGVHMQGGSNQK